MRKFINKILDVPKLILTLWIMLWVILVILLVFKFCFGIWYPIAAENKTFVNVCNFFDENKVANILLRLFFYMLCSNVLVLMFTGRRKYSKWYLALILNAVYVGMFFLKNLLSFLGLIFEVSFIVVCIFINIKTDRFKNKWINIFLPIIAYGLINLWQLLILIVRNTTNYNLDSLPSLVGIIIMLDYYIFLIIMWIGVYIMGTWSWGWFFSKDVTVLKAEKEKELAKANPNMKKIGSINTRISQLEKEGK